VAFEQFIVNISGAMVFSLKLHDRMPMRLPVALPKALSVGHSKLSANLFMLKIT
jgi:hypothetical protein